VITTAPGDDKVNHGSETSSRRDDLRQEFVRLTRHYVRLAWSMNASDQRERTDLNKTLMKMYCVLNPSTKHFWYEDFDVVLRGMRRAS
jgi:hypothetical protein